MEKLIHPIARKQPRESDPEICQLPGTLYISQRSIFFSISQLSFTLLRINVFIKIWHIAPVVQVVNLEFYLRLSPGFEPQVGRTFDYLQKSKSNGFNC